jgi:hypothetical protein
LPLATWGFGRSYFRIISKPISQFPDHTIMPAKKAVALNKRAVASLLSGRSKKALALLSTATTILKDHFADARKAPCVRSSSTSFPACNDEGNEYSSAMEMNVEQDQPSVLSFQVQISSLSQDAPLILNYSRCLTIVDDVEDKELLTSVILYNMALVNHCRAIELGISSLLSISLKLYKMAASVLESTRDVDASNELVLLAIYNNMAQIHAYQWSSQDLRECIDKIRMLLSTVSAESFISQEDFHFFSANTMLHVEDMNLAPAA